MEYFTVTDDMRNTKIYNGNTVKFGITVQDADYIVKFPKGNDMSVYCEYICSAFICSLGVSCHKVWLGLYHGTLVDVILDFTSGRDYTLHSFKSTKQSSEDTDINTKEYTYDDVLYLIDKHLKMTEEHKYKSKLFFWDMFLCDAIIGNRDRHWGNWGYLAQNLHYTAAPLYDNGAGLFPNVNDVIAQYRDLSNRKQFLYDRIFIFPASLLKIKRKDRAYRSNYYEMFSDTEINELFAMRVQYFKETFSYEIIFHNICAIVSPIDITDDYKRFYIEIITLRYMCIILRMDFNKSYKIVEELLNEKTSYKK